jgi:hypothetical protein
MDARCNIIQICNGITSFILNFLNIIKKYQIKHVRYTNQKITVILPHFYMLVLLGKCESKDLQLSWLITYEIKLNKDGTNMEISCVMN